jgi:SAM-dependent methyltransferase
MKLKQSVANTLRKIGLLGISDKTRYLWQKLYYARVNRHFRNRNPSIKFPPSYFIYETYRLNYAEYLNDGYDTAREFIDLIKKNIFISANDKLLDWGCGPARIVRHMPTLLPQSKIYGTDYNPEYIAWCNANIPNVQFSLNSIEPPLDYNDNFFSAIIGLSVFTHLSIKEHLKWVEELHRILKKGGILIITTQGMVYRNKLLAKEKEKFNEHQIVVRDNFRQGHKLYSAFQPKEAIKKIIEKKFSVTEFVEGNRENEQDIWVLKKQ